MNLRKFSLPIAIVMALGFLVALYIPQQPGGLAHDISFESGLPDTSSAPSNTAPKPTTANERVNLTRTDSQGSVVVEVTPLNLYDPGDTLDFQVSMDTHSVDLSMDLVELATLTTDTGQSITASAWNGPRGGHHVSGKLSFPLTPEVSSILKGAQTLTLKITSVDAPERTFEWDLP